MLSVCPSSREPNLASLAVFCWARERLTVLVLKEIAAS